MNRGEKFAEEKLIEMFNGQRLIIDIGGGLRLDKSKNNRAGGEWSFLNPLLKQVDYKVLDKVPDYNPDIVGDVHELPFEDESIDSFVAMCILTHVEDPQKAMKEIYRCLKPGGQVFMFLPFLFYYHPLGDYYKDFWRFTEDGIKHLTRDFKMLELESVRGPIATLINLIPIFSKKTGGIDWIDRLLKPHSKQVSGYYVLGTK